MYSLALIQRELVEGNLAIIVETNDTLLVSRTGAH